MNSIALSIAVALTLAAPLDGQLRRSGGPEYDVAKEITVNGTIVKTYIGPMNELLILEIAVDGKPLHLLLAPPDSVKKTGFTFPAGAAVEVKGQPGFKVDGHGALLVREVKAGKQTLTLRDRSGKPAWPQS
jgi:hypothetical protein